MTKKIGFFVCALFLGVVLFGGAFAISYGIASRVYKTESAVTEEKPAPKDDAVHIAVTAVGDCTLGMDSSFFGTGNFPDVLRDNGGDYSYFLANVKEYFKTDDITIVNLEGPLSRNGTRMNKKYAFYGEPEYARVLATSSVDAANLANNHIMDYGETAHEETKDALCAHDITPFGNDLISLVEKKGITIGLIGVNALNAGERNGFRQNLERLKAQKPDLIVASFHWGAESAVRPNGDQVTMAHMAIDEGVDLVIGHHPHVLQGVEKYKGKYIVYSLGNFCFGGNRNPADMDTMIFRQVFTFEKGELTDLEDVSIVPCSITSEKGKNNFQPTIAEGDEYNRIRDKIVNRSSGYPGIENVSFRR